MRVRWPRTPATRPSFKCRPRLGETDIDPPTHPALPTASFLFSVFFRTSPPRFHHFPPHMTTSCPGGSALPDTVLPSNGQAHTRELVAKFGLAGASNMVRRRSCSRADRVRQSEGAVLTEVWLVKTGGGVFHQSIRLVSELMGSRQSRPAPDAANCAALARPPLMLHANLPDHLLRTADRPRLCILLVLPFQSQSPPAARAHVPDTHRHPETLVDDAQRSARGRGPALDLQGPVGLARAGGNVFGNTDGRVRRGKSGHSGGDGRGRCGEPRRGWGRGGGQAGRGVGERDDRRGGGESGRSGKPL